MEPLHIHVDFGLSEILSRLELILTRLARLEENLMTQAEQIAELKTSVQALEDATTQLGVDLEADLVALRNALGGQANPEVAQIIQRLQAGVQRVRDLDAEAAAALQPSP